MKGKKALLAGAIFVSSILAYNCGGGGGGGGGTVSSETVSGGTTLDIYATDAPPAGLTAFEVDLYTIALCNDVNCNTIETVFSNPNGVSIDLTNIEGTLLYLDTSTVTPGTYPAVKVEINQNATAVIDGQVQSYTIDCQTNTNGNCEFIIPVSLDTTQTNKLILDFNLSQATFDPVNNTVTNFAVQPVDPTQVQTRGYKYEVYGEVVSIDNGQITFNWRGETYIAQVGPNSVCEIKINGQEAYYVGAECQAQLANISPGACIELKLEGDPAQATQFQNVIKLETTNPKKCGKYNEQADNDDYYEEYKYERYIDITAMDFTNRIIALPEGQSCSISENVYCEIDDMNEEDRYLSGQNCLNALQSLPMNIPIRAEVKYRMTADGNCEIYKIEVDDLDDYYEHDDNYNSNDNYGNMNDNYMEYNENHNDNYEGNMNENDNYGNMNGNDNYYENNENHNANVNQPL